MSPPRMAIVHEWVGAYAGSEQVFEAMAQAFPAADLYALTWTPGVELEVGGRPVTTTLLDRPSLRDRRALTLPLMPLAWRVLRGGYDTVLTSHHAFATSNRLAGPGGKHLAYVHSPARYVWTPELDARGAATLLTPVRRTLGALDRRAAGTLHSIAANSSAVARRVERFWNREAHVLHPPVDTEFFHAGSDSTSRLSLPSDYLLALGRFVAYKEHEFVIALGERVGRPVVVAGAGPLAGALRARAARATIPVVVVEAPTRREVRELLRRAAVFVFPNEEDFGIVPVEAMSCGTPVLALNRGGAVETVREGVSGALADRDLESFVEALHRAEVVDGGACALHAQSFSRAAFSRALHAWVQSTGP